MSQSYVGILTFCIWSWTNFKIRENKGGSRRSKIFDQKLWFKIFVCRRCARIRSLANADIHLVHTPHKCFVNRVKFREVMRIQSQNSWRAKIWLWTLRLGHEPHFYEQVCLAWIIGITLSWFNSNIDPTIWMFKSFYTNRVWYNFNIVIRHWTVCQNRIHSRNSSCSAIGKTQ